MKTASLALTLFVAFVCILSVVHAAYPLYPHIAFTHNDNDVYISFWTNTSMIARTPEVKYGTTSGQLTLRANGTSRTYHPSVGYCHDVLVSGLQQLTRYFYKVGSDADGWSREFDFQLKRTNTTPTPTDPVVIPVFGDMGILHSADTIASLAAMYNKVDFYYHVGDISYANDRHSDLYETVWSAWFLNMTKIMPYAPYMVLPGNHEARSGRPFLGWSERFAVYNKRFMMPGSGGEKENMWYSFNYKNIHFVSMSTETDFEGCEFPEMKFGDQLAWLERDLAEANSAANRKLRPWLIVSGHKPVYSSSKFDTAPIQAAFEKLFHKYKVDIFFCGHVHAYERTYPVFENKVTSHTYHDPQGLVVVTTGASGDIEGISHSFKKPPPEWSAHTYDEGTGYGVWTVESNNKATWEFYSSRTRKLIDSFVFTKP